MVVSSLVGIQYIREQMGSHFQPFRSFFLEIFPFARIPICSRIKLQGFEFPFLSVWSVLVLKTVSFDNHFQCVCVFLRNILICLNALEATLRQHGVSVPSGAAVDAALAEYCRKSR